MFLSLSLVKVMLTHFVLTIFTTVVPQTRERLIQSLKDDLDKSRQRISELDHRQMLQDAQREKERMQRYVAQECSVVCKLPGHSWKMCGQLAVGTACRRVRSWTFAKLIWVLVWGCWKKNLD